MSQRDNAMNLKQTEATLRDSSDMRAIAWVTLAFLPATFVAVRSLFTTSQTSSDFYQTFFSSSFFNFEQKGRRVSDWIWLYCVISVILTVGVHAGWAVWIRKERRV